MCFKYRLEALMEIFFFQFQKYNMDKLKCKYCDYFSGIFTDTILHFVHNHPKEKVNIKIRVDEKKNKFKHLKFDLRPEDEILIGKKHSTRWIKNLQ